MTLYRSSNDDRGVSIVIGTVLLVGIVSIAMAVLGAAILGTDFVDQSPRAEFVYQEDRSGTVAIALSDVQRLIGDETEIKLRGEGSCGTWEGSGALEDGDLTRVSWNDCPTDLEEGDVLQVIGSNTLLDTYELQGRYPDHGCEAIPSSDFDDGSQIELDSGDTIACELTDGGNRLDNSLQIDQETSLIGDVKLTKAVELTTSGTNEIVGDISTQKGVDVKDGSIVVGSIEADKSVDVYAGSEVDGPIEAGEDVMLDSDATVNDDITVTGSGRLVEVDDATVTDDVHADDNDVVLKGDGAIDGDVTADAVECKDDSEINGDITADSNTGC